MKHPQLLPHHQNQSQTQIRATHLPRLLLQQAHRRHVQLLPRHLPTELLSLELPRERKEERNFSLLLL
jgi:hypothetical protein